MTVRIYSVFEKFAPAVEVGGKIIPVVAERMRRWEDRDALAAALGRRGYVEQKDGSWEFENHPHVGRGRPITQTLESQAEKRSRRGCN